MPIAPATTVNVRYMVANVEAALAWYTKYLGLHRALQRCSSIRGRHPWIAAPIAQWPD